MRVDVKVGGYIFQKYYLRLECDDLGDGKELACGPKDCSALLPFPLYQFRINLGVQVEILGLY
jgi:hypothetical protein